MRVVPCLASRPAGGGSIAECAQSRRFKHRWLIRPAVWFTDEAKCRWSVQVRHIHLSRTEDKTHEGVSADSRAKLMALRSRKGARSSPSPGSRSTLLHTTRKAKHGGFANVGRTSSVNERSHTRSLIDMHRDRSAKFALFCNDP